MFFIKLSICGPLLPCILTWIITVSELLFSCSHQYNLITAEFAPGKPKNLALPNLMWLLNSFHLIFLGMLSLKIEIFLSWNFFLSTASLKDDLPGTTGSLLKTVWVSGCFTATCFRWWTMFWWFWLKFFGHDIYSFSVITCIGNVNCSITVCVIGVEVFLEI